MFITGAIMAFGIPPYAAAAVGAATCDIHVCPETPDSPETVSSPPAPRTPAARLASTLRNVREMTVNGIPVRWGEEITAAQKAAITTLLEQMVRVKGGTFRMGETGGESLDDEAPVHSVTLSDFHIGSREIPQSLWQAVTGTNPSANPHPDCPVENVSYEMCLDFIRRLRALSGVDFSLPTEAQWEYAARGGSRSAGYTYPGSDDIKSVGWIEDTSRGETHPVGTLASNELGLYDMAGNVREWCLDWYGIYADTPQTDPAGPETGAVRVVRGGAWTHGKRAARPSMRHAAPPAKAWDDTGLRLVIN